MAGDKIRKEIIAERGDCCEQCGRSISKDNIKLEVHHIDGNHKNNDKRNLKLLCSLCHSYTESYCNSNNRRKAPSDEELYQALLASESVSEALRKLDASDNSISRSRAYQMIVERRISSYIDRELAKMAEKEKRANNNGKLHNCIDCGKPINKEKGRCKKCSNAHKRAELSQCQFSRDELKSLIRTHSFTEIGRMCSVSGNAVKKWCKRFGLPYRSHDIASLSDIEWEQEVWNEDLLAPRTKKIFDYEDIANDYEKGMTTQQLCDKYSCSADTVLKSCHMFNKCIRTAQELAKTQLSKRVINATTEQVFDSMTDAMIWVWKERGNRSPSQSQIRGGITHIKDCCIGKSKTAYGYQWRYE